jgi:uncharacterized protein (TIGR02646 family)
MVYIKKGAEPRSFEQWRLGTPNASYDGLPTNIKNDIRAHLLREQGYVCAYCMGQINEENTRIEHYIPRSVDKSLELDFINMLGVCPGFIADQRICEQNRDSKALTVNPLVYVTIATISYTSDASISSSSIDVFHDLDGTLNLNAALLKENRKQALFALKDELAKRIPKGTWKHLAHRYIKKMEEAGIKQPYYGILLFYLYKLCK